MHGLCFVGSKGVGWDLRLMIFKVDETVIPETTTLYR